MSHPIKTIRTAVLGASQMELAALTSTSQATVSRWESGELFPDLRHMAAIRSAARTRGIKWRDEWFFDPATIPAKQRAAR
ncbi:MAG TPA: helix-turn-helix transcriptional regulator [Magnetospirillum sp.]|nr:helix-turn-helix transcriptional regulator [Magnetospirillum sp.]